MFAHHDCGNIKRTGAARQTSPKSLMQKLKKAMLTPEAEGLISLKYQDFSDCPEQIYQDLGN